MERMPHSRRASVRLLSVLAIVMFAAAACGSSGGGASGGDPAGVVKDALSTVQAKDMTKLQDLACAAKKDEVAKQFDFSSALASAAPGVDSKQILDALTIDTSKVTIGSATITGDNATVPVSGTMSMKVDTEKLKPIIKTILEGQGLPADDATINQAMGMFAAFGSQDVPMDETLKLVKENGAWKICE